MTHEQMIAKRDALVAMRDDLLKDCFTIDQLADYFLDNGVIRLTKTGRRLPRERAKVSLVKSLGGARYADTVKSEELQIKGCLLWPDNPHGGWICSKAEADRRLAVELERQERRLKRKGVGRKARK